MKADQANGHEDEPPAGGMLFTDILTASSGMSSYSESEATSWPNYTCFIIYLTPMAPYYINM
jgi:hypothetical protein